MTRPEPAYATLRHVTTVGRVLKRKRPRPTLNSLEVHGEFRKPGFIVSERRVAR